MHLELEPDKVGQDGRAARLRFDGGGPLARFGPDDGEAVRRDGEYRGQWMSDGRIADGRGLGVVKGGMRRAGGGRQGLSGFWGRDLRDDVGTCRRNRCQLDTVSVIGKERG